MLNYDTILQLDLFYKREGKWTEIPYVQLFFFLKEHPQWVEWCKRGAQILTMVCKNMPKDGDTSKTPPVAPKRATPPLPPKGNEEGDHPTPKAPLPPYLAAVGCYPLQPVPRGRGSHLERIHVPFRLSNLKEINLDLDSFINDLE
jgi:hypothetical protein